MFRLFRAIVDFVAMLCYIPVAHLADRHGQRPFVLATFVFFTAFPVVLAVADSFAALVLAFAVRGLKEFGEAARKALIIAQPAPHLRARTYGAYYLIRDSVVTSGSLLGAWLWTISPYANFATAAGFGLLGTLWFWWYQARPPMLQRRWRTNSRGLDAAPETMHPPNNLGRRHASGIAREFPTPRPRHS